MKPHSNMTVKDTPISRALTQIDVLLFDTIKDTMDTSTNEPSIKAKIVLTVVCFSDCLTSAFIWKNTIEVDSFEVYFLSRQNMTCSKRTRSTRLPFGNRVSS